MATKPELAAELGERIESDAFHAAETPTHEMTDLKADQMLRHLIGLDEETRSLDQLCDAEIAAIESWREMRKAQTDLDRRRLVRALEGWMRNRFEDASKPAPHSVELPHGALHLYKGRGKVEVTDKETLIKWAVENGFTDLVRVPDPPEPQPDRIALAKLTKIVLPDGSSALCVDGEFVPGVSYVEPDGPVFKFTLGGEVEA